MINYSIIISTYNRASYLEDTIKSVLEALVNRDDFELLIIDNNSTDSTKTVIESFLKNLSVRYIAEYNQGLSHARNRGIKESIGDVLVFLDDDLELDINYFKILDSKFLTPGNDIIGGKVLPYQAIIPNWLPSKYYYLASVFDLGDEEKEVGVVMGANYAMRRLVAVNIGKYDIHLGRNGKKLLGGEEVDYMKRATLKNYKILYTPQLIVYHKINEKLNQNYIYNYAYMLGKSEIIIDGLYSIKKANFKKIKAKLMVLFYPLINIMVLNSKSKSYLKIANEFSRGYLNIN
ncbi:glycosyltransferase [Inquilinus sp. KBS0705]|nr:glycosyltransferase [Inquilinus sp. KBS0705]